MGWKTRRVEGMISEGEKIIALEKETDVEEKER